MIPSTLQPFLKNRAFWYGIVLAMADSAAGTIASIYGYTIILSDYPASYLIYYIVMQTLCTALLRTLGLRFVAKNYKKNALIQYGFFIFFFITSIVLMQIKAFAIPFIVAVITSGMVALSSITSWSMLSLSFGMREYKTVAKYSNQAAYLSSIISSFIIPVLSYFFPINALLGVSTIMLSCCMLAIYNLPIQKLESPQKNSKKMIKPSLVKFPLYYYMMIFSVLIATIGGITQYTMRLESAVYFTHAQLSSFFGYFSGICNILGFLVAATSDHVLKRFGLKGLLGATPFFSLICALIVFFYPSFWSVVVLGSIRAIFGFSYGAYSSEITLNILPPEIRFLTKSNIKSTANIASMLLLVSFTVGKTNIHFITMWTPILCSLALIIVYKITQYYKITLQQESAFKRYNVLEEITPATRPILQEIALQSLTAKNTYTVFYGLDLLATLYTDKELPNALYALLSHENPAIRNAVINLLTKRTIPKALPFLIEQLPKENNNQIQFKIIEEIAHQDLNTALKIINQETINKNFAFIIKNLYFYLNTQKKDKALQNLKDLCEDSNPHIRQMLASLIGTFKINALSDTLKTLIADPNPLVHEEALCSVKKMPSDSLIPSIITLALQNKKSLAAQFALITLGKSSLPYLAEKASQIKNSKTIIQTIAAIPEVEAEQTLLSLLPKATMYVRSLVAKYANNRVCKLLPSPEFKARADEFIREECCIIYHLQKKLATTTNTRIQKEIQLRIISAKVRFLQWLAIATRPREINQLMSSLIQDQTKDLVLDKAIELLEIYIEEPTTRQYIDYIFDNKTLGNSTLLSNDYPDAWLERIMNDTANQSSLLSIVFELRAVRLFQSLPAEILLALAEEVQYHNYERGALIFSKDDKPDGLYCVSQGEVSITRDNRVVTTISEHGFFGELALLDESPRVANAEAKTACTIIYIEKDVFNRIADDVTDVLRAVVKIILEYARKNLDHAS